MRRAGAAALGVVIAATSLSLAVGFIVKDLCTKRNWDGYQYRTSCYNDIYALYSFRGLGTHDHDGVPHEPHFPYVDGDGDLDTENDGDLEYPVLTGYVVGAIARIASGGQAFFRLNALALAAGAFAAALTLMQMRATPRRLLLFALAPSLMLYAFHNWDLLAVAAATVGLLAFQRRFDGWTGIALGLGAAAKLYPGLLLVPLALVRAREDRQGAARLFGAGVVSFVAVNLPVMLINFRGWLTPWEFNSSRFPNYETSWYMIYRHLAKPGESFWFEEYTSITSMASLALFAVGAVTLLRAEARRGVMRPWELCFGVMLIFLLTAKVYSPQFALWILPFLVLVPLPWPAIGAFFVTDAAVWFAISSYFLASPPVAAGDPELRMTLVEIAVFARYAVLGWMLWLTRRPNDASVPALLPQTT
ncbi:MAG TPA: glycosyltransferase 87 family protein [Actinomycetota bacterium]|nr:glycosyltransferase 87 family protein [Actinomycetota bacterium]